MAVKFDLRVISQMPCTSKIIFEIKNLKMFQLLQYIFNICKSHKYIQILIIILLKELSAIF